MKKALALFTIAGCLLVVFTRCNKTNTVASAELRVFNVDPTLPAQDMYLDGQLQLTALPYGNDTAHVSIQPGTYNIKFANTGAGAGDAVSNIDFTTGKNYMMFLLNNNGTTQFEAFDESLLRLGQDTSEIRFFTFSPNAPLMDIGIKNTDTSKLDTTYTFYRKRYPNDVYANRVYNNFTRLPSGTYYLKLRYADSLLAFDSVLFTFSSRKSYTILARGNYNSTGSTPFVVESLQH